MHSGVIGYFWLIVLIALGQSWANPEESATDNEASVDGGGLEAFLHEFLAEEDPNEGKRDEYSRILRSPNTFSRILRSPSTFSRILRSPSTFSRILRSSFSRIHRDPSSTFSRILREASKSWDKNDLKRESFSRILRAPGFSRISKSDPLSRIL